VKNYYQILGLKDFASKEEIKKAYRLYSLKFHPDMHQNDEFFSRRFIEIKEAYDILSDVNQRAVYDKKLWGGENSIHQQYSQVNNKDEYVETLEREIRELKEQIIFEKTKIQEFNKKNFKNLNEKLSQLESELEQFINPPKEKDESQKFGSCGCMIMGVIGFIVVSSIQAMNEVYFIVFAIMIIGGFIGYVTYNSGKNKE
jgi:DnaJ-class molecular chaperone